MKTSTFYVDNNGKKQVYTTLKHTDMHRHLRDSQNGKTYRHEDAAKLFFVSGGFPLDRPIGGKVERVK